MLLLSRYFDFWTATAEEVDDEEEEEDTTSTNNETKNNVDTFVSSKAVQDMNEDELVLHYNAMDRQFSKTIVQLYVQNWKIVDLSVLIQPSP